MVVVYCTVLWARARLDVFSLLSWGILIYNIYVLA